MGRMGLVLMLLCAGFPAVAGECKSPGDADRMVADIMAAPTCNTAAAIARDCAFGAGGDIALTAAVSEVCEKDFLAGLTSTEAKTYRRERAACIRKYAKQQGTMYVSASAFCEAGVSQLYSRAALAKPARR